MKFRRSFIRAQQEGVSLERARIDAQNLTSVEEGTGRFVMQDGLLYREPPTGKKQPHGKICKQLVVPEEYRSVLLKLAHDGRSAGHLGIEKTCDGLKQNFYWPYLF